MLLLYVISSTFFWLLEQKNNTKEHRKIMIWRAPPPHAEDRRWLDSSWRGWGPPPPPPGSSPCPTLLDRPSLNYKKEKIGTFSQRGIHLGKGERELIRHCLEKEDTGTALQRASTENGKQIFPEKDLRGNSPNFHSHVSVRDLFIPTIDLPIMLQEICGPILGIYKPFTEAWMWKLGLRAAQFPEKEYINGIFLAVRMHLQHK